MAESSTLLVDEVFPHQPVRQLAPGMARSRAMQEQLPRVLSFPFQFGCGPYVFYSQSSGDHGPGVGHRLPRHLHASAQEGRLFEKDSSHWSSHIILIIRLY